MLQKKEFDRSEYLFRLWRTVAAVSGVFSFLVFALIGLNYVLMRQADPVNHEIITKMRIEYAAAPEKDEALAERIRELDLLNRKAIFTSQYHLRTGAVLLLIGVSVFLISFKNTIRWQREKPALTETPTAEVEFLAFEKSRHLITWLGVGLLAGGLLTALLTESALVETATIGGLASSGEDESGTSNAAGGENAQASVLPFEKPAWDAIQLNWPTFRGPGSCGMAHFANAPSTWDIETGAGVRWKTELGLPGANSPVVWADRIFMSGADATAREVYCYNADDGTLLWKKAVDTGTSAAVDVTDDTGFAAPTMAVHGNRVFAIFANGDLASFDVDGNPAWSKNVGVPDNHYGHASSLVAYEGLLYVQLDDNSQPKLMALDVETGDQQWAANRDRISWSSPILASTNFGQQLMLTSEKTVDAYAPLTGAMLWSQECLGGEVAPSAAYRDGIVFAANENAKASAIEMSGSAESIQTQILWEYDDYLPEVASPIGDGERFYYATSVGELVSLNAKTGAEAWVEEVSDEFYSSPILVGDRIYVADTDGIMFIVRAGAEFELIGKQSLGEPTYATPAYLDGRVYVRTTGHLICIENENA